MNIVCISDTHNKHNLLELPEGDMIIHCGDMSNTGSIGELQSFAKWFSSLNYKYKICIAGNHDFGFQNNSTLIRDMLEGVHYLENSSIVIEGIHFYGSPVTPRFGNWAFYRDRGEQIQEIWKQIPNNVDVLITHCPPAYILDYNHYNESCGCADLRTEVIQRVKPKFHIFGHIHESKGIEHGFFTTYINAAVSTGYNSVISKKDIFTFNIEKEN